MLAAEYCALVTGAVAVAPVEVMVTPLAPWIVTCPAPICWMLIIAPVAYATDELSGTVKVMAAALLKVTRRPLSVRTKVYVVPVCAFRFIFWRASLMVGVLIVGLVKVLLVSVCVAVSDTTVSVMAGSVSVPDATAEATRVVVPLEEPDKAQDATGLVLDSNQVKSSEVRTCFTVAPAACVTADEPALPLVIVKVSLDAAVIKTISSLFVSGSSATVNWSLAPNVTPPRRAEPVPAATVIEVALFDIPEASVVSTLIDENLRTAICLPYLV
jgi:hypothetical protein